MMLATSLKSPMCSRKLGGAPRPVPEDSNFKKKILHPLQLCLRNPRRPPSPSGPPHSTAGLSRDTWSCTNYFSLLFKKQSVAFHECERDRYRLQEVIFQEAAGRQLLNHMTDA